MTKHIMLESLELRRLFAALTLDSTFGINGHVITDLFGNHDVINAVAVQSDGKIIAAGESQKTFLGKTANNFAIARYNSDGNLDDGGINDLTPGDSFGISGVASLLYSSYGQRIQSIAIQPDGKIIAAGTANGQGGTSNWMLARYNINGTLDRTFGTKGVVTAFPNTVATLNCITLQSDGKIVAVGSYQGNFEIGRFDTVGVPDSTFDGDGFTSVDFGGSADTATGVVIDNVNNVVIGGQGVDVGAGSRAVVARLGPTGIPDKHFGTSGKSIMSFAGKYNSSVSGLVIRPNGLIILSGELDTDFFGKRLLAGIRWDVGQDGSQANAFSTASESFSCITKDFTGESVSGGYAFIANGPTLEEQFLASRPTLIPDTFYVSGVSHANAIASQADGNLILAGFATVGGLHDFALIRLVGTNPNAYGSISGKIYNDLNGNALPGSNEKPLANVRVFLDTNGNGVIDPAKKGIPAEISVISDSHGNYQFNGLNPGFYNVQEITPSGFTRTQPLAGSYRGRVLANHNSTGFNFGNQLVTGGIPKGLSASLTLGSLSIQGTGDADVIGVNVKNGLYNVSVNGETQTFPISRVMDIVITTLGGNDLVQLTNTGVISANIDGGSGNDSLYGTAADDTINGGIGRDLIYGLGGNDRIAGGDDADTIFGGDGKDRISAQGGDDSVSGDAGRDIISGGEGKDTLIGGTSNDVLYGNAGDDILNGQSGNDYLDGGDGNDTAKLDPNDLTRIAVELLV